ncbi:glycosyltransferase family 39 protein [Candidatus Woesebacteria bacterium]|nr:glycosyltransferase family 39 protein [Candidatus Woesebacteria bacterium]
MMKLIKNTVGIKNLFTPYILLSLLGVFFIKLALSFLPSFSIDMGTWLAWAYRMKDLGPPGFYSPHVWTQYTPGYLYWLWLIGKAGLVSEAAIKIPTILADIAAGGVIWSIIKKRSLKTANLAFFLYVLNPVILFNGSVWGQIDGIHTLFLLLTIYFLVERKAPLLVGIIWAISFLIKPQSIVLLPPILIIGLKKFSTKEWVLATASSAVAIYLSVLPFFPHNTVFSFVTLLKTMTDYYSYTSVFAFNFWSIIGMWKPDSTAFLGVTYFTWGVILYAASLVITFVLTRRDLAEKKYTYLIVAISVLVSFVFPTRVHERYLFPFLAFFLISVGLTGSVRLFNLFLLVSLLNFINLYHPYAYYSHNFLRSEDLLRLTTNIAPWMGILMVTTPFLIWIIYKFKLIDTRLDGLVGNFKISLNLRKFTNNKIDFPKLSISSRTSKVLLAVILVFSFLTKVAFLWSPPSEYFDEVYHAFTARTILHRDPKAWEWWNTPPAGFAYEWTHPPLAKLGMVAGMLIFGENSFGWRVPGALLGTGSVLLVYLISKKIFEDEALALLVAAIFSLDGLVLVMSRIGMNDIYHLFFMLLAIYLFLEDKNFFSAASYGLALSSKWSALWAIPIFFVIWALFKRNFKLSYLWFIVVPPVVYLLSYFDMFSTGHGINIWWGMQEQMWWYHTRLRATHPYTSAWWSWPLLLRPIYLYTSDEINSNVARIYAFGNPAVFWFGLVSVFITGLSAFKQKSKGLFLVVFSYLIFFAPWAFSPRIMFLYHYLPSIPFLAIAAGYVLRKNLKFIMPFFIVAGVLFVYFYPHWAGLTIPLWLDKSYYWFSSWR